MKTVVISLLALTLALGSFCTAADYPAKAYKADKSSQEVQMNVSQDGFAAMQAVRAARVAIFNGEPNVTTQMLNKAKNGLYAVTKNASPFTPFSKTTGGGQPVTGKTQTAHTVWIPIDGSVALAETYVPSPEKAGHINKANKFFKNGQSKEAINELWLGEIDVTYTCVLMPLEATIKCVTEATRLANEHKYYEANLALKAAEDGLIVDSTSLIGMPNVDSEKQLKQSKW
ncbi:MAG: YfdX family protein [Pirellulales bacterium]|nr:YfdX family protein [Pirellulales bacterium]